MTKPLDNDFQSLALMMSSQFAPVIARLAGSGPDDEILVDTGTGTPCTARLMAGADRRELGKVGNRGREVLVVFQNGDRTKPIIVGLMDEPLESLVQMKSAAFDLSERKKEVRIDGKRLVIEAKDEIELKCGQGSITIRKDGKIVVKGTNLLSRSAGPNRIKGGSISLN